MKSLLRGPVFLLLSLLLPWGLAAEGPATVEAWLSGPLGRDYASLAPELLRDAALARDRGIPEYLLVERLDEGARKRSPPARLGAAIGQDLDRYTALLGLLGRRGETPREAELLGALLRQGGILLRAGCGEAELEACLAAAETAGPGKGAAARAFRAAAVALDASIRFGLDPGRRAALGPALAGSKLPDERLDALLSLLSRARSLGLSAERAADILAEGLRKGAGLEVLERDITQRGLR